MTLPPPARAEIIAVGSELLSAERLDTNSLFITRELNDIGILVASKAVVGDVLEDLTSVFRQALGRADVVVLTGGLGPTDDDLTREAVAQVLGRPLQEAERIIEAIRARFARRGLEMPASNRRQANVIGGAVLLENEFGTAPGQWLDADGRVVILLPGPPRELQPMFQSAVRDVVAPRFGGSRVVRRSLRLCGRTESQFDEWLQPLYRAWAVQRPMAVSATILAAAG